VALLQLSTPVAAQGAFKVSRKYRSDLKELIAFVMNADDDQDKFERLKINSLHCNIHEDTQQFPFELLEKPETILVNDCVAVHGNSGSPAFAPDDLSTIQTLLYAVDDGKSPQSPWSFNAFPVKDPPMVVYSSTVACAPLPGFDVGEGRCAPTKAADHKMKRDSLPVKAFLNAMSQWIDSENGDANPVMLLPEPISSAVEGGDEIYVFPTPVCLRPDHEDFGSLTFLTEIHTYRRQEDAYSHSTYEPERTSFAESVFVTRHEDGYVYQLSTDREMGWFRTDLDLSAKADSDFIDGLEAHTQRFLKICTGQEKAKMMKAFNSRQ
jgi:hypothetical protein